MNSNLKKGLVTGGIVGGVLTGLFMSKKGKELRGEAMKYATELYHELEKKAEHLTELSQEKYDELVELLVKEFSKKKEMAEELKDQVVADLKDRWEHVQIDGLAKMVMKRYDELEKKTKDAYTEVVEDIVEAYASEKKIAADTKTRFIRELKKRWQASK